MTATLWKQHLNAGERQHGATVLRGGAKKKKDPCICLGELEFNRGQ